MEKMKHQILEDRLDRQHVIKLYLLYFCLHFFFFFNLRERMEERMNTPSYCLTPHLSESRPKQGPAIQVSHWVSGMQLLEPSSPPPRLYRSRKLKSGAGAEC